MNKLDLKEKLLGGLFGLVAIGAAITEMFVNGLTLSTFIGAIKDVSGTMVVVVLLLTVIKHYLPKKANNINQAFEMEMQPIIKKYSPLIVKDGISSSSENFKVDKNGDSTVRYNIASYLSAIYDNAPGEYHTFFDFNLKSELKFSVSKTVFIGRSKEDFDDQGKIISEICRNIEKYEIVSNCSNMKDGFKVTLSKKMETNEEVKQVIEVIDRVMLLYIAEYKKT
jgi:hypothetical protein